MKININLAAVLVVWVIGGVAIFIYKVIPSDAELQQYAKEAKSMSLRTAKELGLQTPKTVCTRYGGIGGTTYLCAVSSDNGHTVVNFDCRIGSDHCRLHECQ